METIFNIMFDFIIIIWIYHLLYLVYNYPFPKADLTILLLWPFYYLISLLAHFFMKWKIVSYMIMLSPLIISASIKTTIIEGIFSTCIACIFR